MERITTPPPLPERPVEGHKGIFGRVLVVGGNDGMIGAPVLAATTALRMGSGLVQIAVPRSILATCLSITPELIGLGLLPQASRDGAEPAGEDQQGRPPFQLQLGAPLRTEPRRGAPDTRAGAGDENALAREARHVVSPRGSRA